MLQMEYRTVPSEFYKNLIAKARTKQRLVGGVLKPTKSIAVYYQRNSERLNKNRNYTPIHNIPIKKYSAFNYDMNL